MISVVIPTFNAENHLVGCLAPLVPASMAGLVRELVVVDAGSTDATQEIADDAGARIVKSAGGVSAGVAVAKGPWILALDPAVRLERGWETAVQSHIEASRAPARFHTVVSRENPFARHTPAERRTTATGRSPGSRVIVRCVSPSRMA